MPFPRKRSPVQFSEQELLKLESIRKSRTEEKRRTLRAAFLLDSLSGQSDEAIAQHHHVSRSTVVLCIQKFLQFRSGRSPGRIAPTRQAAATAGRCDCLGSTLCLPEAEGTGIFIRIVDVQVAGGSRTPALRRGRASVAAQTEPLQTPQDPAAGRTATAQDSILRGDKGPGLRNQNGQRAARLQRGRDRQ